MKQLILFLFFSFSVFSQQLHHQMLSSQASSSTLSRGIMVNHTIGQQSIIGNAKISTAIVGQGFQQSRIPTSGTLSLIEQISTTTYPNPFIDQINFQFSKPVNGTITITIFDLLGRLVYKDEKEAIQNRLTLYDLHFPQSEYLVKLSAPNYNYSTQILQSK